MTQSSTAQPAVTIATDDNSYADRIRQRVLVRLDTLIRLRWYAIIGQFGAICVVAFGFGYKMPWLLCLLLVGVSAALNMALAQRYRANHRLMGEGAFWLLAFDVFHLGILLFLTGGLQNPFAILLIAPVVVSSTSLHQYHTLALGLLALAIITWIGIFHLPLPWDSAIPLQTPTIFLVGVWVAIVCTLAFTAIYVFRVAEEARKLADALTATELVLQRENHLTALDGLAAAAAHELGTPLATIALVSKEMVHALPEDSPMRDDAKLLRSQAQRCRDILQKLTSLSSEGEPIIERQSISALIEEVINPLRDFGVAIEVNRIGDSSDELYMDRSPAIHYGLGNVLDNAVDFARSKVVVDVECTADTIRLVITDDGPGFPAAILAKLGEPFVSTRGAKPGQRRRGMGLGMFIAKTLLERSGADLQFANAKSRTGERKGAIVTITWQRDAFEQSLPEPSVNTAQTGLANA